MDANHQEEARRRVHELLSRFTILPLYRKLQNAARHHELPYYTSNVDVISTAENDTGDDSLQSRYIDILYHDPANGRWVVLDFKTDHFVKYRGETELLQWATEKAYAAQVEAYAHAVRDLLQLSYIPAALLCLLDCVGKDGGREARLLEIETNFEQER